MVNPPKGYGDWCSPRLKIVYSRNRFALCQVGAQNLAFRGLSCRRFNFPLEPTNLLGIEEEPQVTLARDLVMVEKQKPQLAAAPLNDQPDKASGPTEKAEADLEARILELGEDLGKEKSKSDDLFRRLQYLQADFENYRKRMEKEAREAERFGNERLLSDLLVVSDELGLAVKKAGENEQNPVLLEGVEMVLKRLQNLLVKEGVERIDGVGSKFTPELHEAALRVPSDEEEGTIVEEIRPGYLLKGRVLRPSIVKVAEKESAVETEEEKA